MGNVIPAATRFLDRQKDDLKTNMFVVHRKPEEVVDLIEGSISYRTEIIRPGHPEQFMVTGILFTPIAVTDDGYTDQVAVIEIGNGYSSMAEAVGDYANDQGLLGFITNGSVALHLMVLGGGFSNPALPVDAAIVTMGPRMIVDPEDTSGKKMIENPEQYNCHWGDLESFLVGEVLGQCCCGMPDEVLKYTFEAIEHLGMPYDNIPFGSKEKGPRWLNREAAQKKYGHGPLYFLWHNLEVLDLTEHGGSAPGWLTGEGDHFLELLRIEVGRKSETNDDD